MNTSTVHVVIPVFNRLDKTLLCLKFLTRQTYSHIKIIVVDDGSTDGTAATVASEYPGTTIVKTAGNRWWTGSTNDGISVALSVADAGDYVLLLNNDLTFDAGLISHLVQLVKANSDQLVAGAVTADMRDKNRILDGGVVVNWWTAKHRRLNYGRKLTDFPTGHTEDVSVLTGRGVLYPVRAFMDHGLFDDVHFQQCGDYSLPAFLKKCGYALKMNYDARVYTGEDDTDAINCRAKYRLSHWHEYFVGVRSNTNLRYRYFLGKYGASRFQFPFYLVCDVLRVTIHFLRQLGPSKSEA